RAYHADRADEGNTAYAALRQEPPGRLLELPGFLPDDQRGSTYLYYDMAARRERPLGYSTTAPKTADSIARRLRHLNCGRWPRDVPKLDIHYVAIHRGLFRFARCPRRAEAALRAHGFRRLASDGAVTMWTDIP